MTTIERIRDQRLDQLATLYFQGHIGRRSFEVQRAMVHREYDDLFNRIAVANWRRQRRKSGSGDEFAFYACAFNGPPSQHDTVLERGSVDASLFERDPVILFRHSWEDPIARGIDLEEDDSGLIVTGRWNKSRLARDCRTVARERIARGLPVNTSINLTSPIKSEQREWGDGRVVDVISSAKFNECSLVRKGAEPRSEFLWCT
jgi:hypothetical protein